MDATIAPRLIRNAEAAATLFQDIAHAPTEIAIVAFLDPEWRLLGLTRFDGRRNHVAPSIRIIVTDALGLHAAAVILAHGHPAGDPAPSPADLAFTRRLAATLRAIEVTLVDHLIFADDQVVSMREHGLL